MLTINIGSKKIGNNQPCFIISEIGAMYEDLHGMKELIKVSKQSGADAVKLQTYTAENMALKDAIFELDDGRKISQFDFFKKHEITKEDHKSLFKYADEIGIIIFSTPSHFQDVDLLHELGVSAYKTGSDDLTNYPLLEYIAKKGKPMFISTGMSNISEVEEAVKVITRTGNQQLILLHCTVSYPPSPEYANLNIINTLKNAFDLPVGYSDHVLGTIPSVLAVSMGACAVEKHVTLNRHSKRPDYQVSLEPSELNEMVQQIRLVPILRGASVRKVYSTEEKWRRNARKSLVAARKIKKGNKLKKDDVKIMRPGTGIHPKYLKFMIGRSFKRDININEIIPKDTE